MLGRDEPENAGRVEELGLSAPYDAMPPETEIREAATLASAALHDRARLMASRPGYGGGAIAVTLLEQLRMRQDLGRSRLTSVEHDEH